MKIKETFEIEFDLIELIGLKYELSEVMCTGLEISTPYIENLDDIIYKTIEKLQKESNDYMG